MGSSRTAWEGYEKGSSGYRRILVALLCAGVATFAQLYSVQGVLPILAEDLHVDAAQSALAVSSATMGLAVGVIPWSLVSDRWGRRRTMVAAVSAATVLGVLVGLMPTFESLVALRFVEGVALGGIPAVAMAYLAEEVARATEQRRRAPTSPERASAGSPAGSWPHPSRTSSAGAWARRWLP